MHTAIILQSFKKKVITESTEFKVRKYKIKDSKGRITVSELKRLLHSILKTIPQ